MYIIYSWSISLMIPSCPPSHKTIQMRTRLLTTTNLWETQTCNAFSRLCMAHSAFKSSSSYN